MSENPALPDGVVYEQVQAYGGTGQHFRGNAPAGYKFSLID